MSPALDMDPGQVKTFVEKRVEAHPQFRNVIGVSVEKYPSEFSVVVWVGGEPDSQMRQYAYELETELDNLGIPVSIIVKTDRELPFRGTSNLATPRGEFSYRYYKLERIGDEDIVYAFSLHHGADTYRFRMSLSGTLASMLLSRNRLKDDRIIEVYLDRIRVELARPELEPEKTHRIIFNSQHLSLFAGA